MLWSVDRCQERLSADQCHMTVLRAELDWAEVQNFSLSKKLFCGFDHIARFVSVQTGPLIFNLLTSSVRSLYGNLRPRPWSRSVAVSVRSRRSYGKIGDFEQSKFARMLMAVFFLSGFH